MPDLLTPCPPPVRRPCLASIPLGLAFAFMAACAGPKGPGTPPSDAALRSSVESATAAFHQALRTNDTAGVLARVADDVLMLPPGEPPVRGKEAMRTWLSTFLAQYRTSALVLTDREVFVGQGWATELGAYEWHLTPVAGGAATVDRGHYIQVWHQLPGGEWRFARELWNSSPTPASPSSQ